MFEQSRRLLLAGSPSEGEITTLLAPAGFVDCKAAWNILRRLSRDEKSRPALLEILPSLLLRLSGSASPDRVLIYLDRFASSYVDVSAFFQYLSENPRAVELLIMLFSSSQFLSEILLRNPEYLPWLTEYKSLYRPKKLEALSQETLVTLRGATDPIEQMDILRRFQRREMLRIGLSDLLDQFDLAAATRQLSHLADSILRVCLRLCAQSLGLPLDEKGIPAGFAVIAMGKLGGRELNYSSDIDLLFVSERDEEVYQRLGQKLIDMLTRVTSEGFLYRVDMRLRPWGHVGALVPPIAGYLNYLKGPARLWEKQAMLKARLMAGDEKVGNELLQQAGLLLYNLNPEGVRSEVYGMKQTTEDFLRLKGRNWGEVKLGQGSIRDIEFVVQYLQLVSGGRQPEIRNRNTLEALRRLVKYNLLPVDEFRLLTEGYVFLRTIEHHLQMMNYRQTYTLPSDPQALLDLARRLGFQTETAGEQFLARYQQYSAAIRQVYLKYLENARVEPPVPDKLPAPRVRHHLARMDSSYGAVFSRQDIRRHAALAQRLDQNHQAVVEPVPLEDDFWRVTIVAYDYPGELSLICGLLFVHGFNIHDGNAFTYQSSQAVAAEDSRLKIVDVFTVKSKAGRATREVWNQYTADLNSLLARMQAGQSQQARIDLAKRAAASLVVHPGETTPLYPIDITIDNDLSEQYTVLHIEALDTIGFLYELTNALAFNQIYIALMEVETIGEKINDFLYVTGKNGEKITSEGRKRELRAATVLIKHFTHLLPYSPDPESALLHFREFIGQLFQRPDWPDELASLERLDVMQGLAQLLGVSDFLWYDFLRMQHANLFPVVSNIDALHSAKSRAQLQNELEVALKQVAEQPKLTLDTLNDFKDREMFRIDMRHILGHTAEFWEFSEELTDLAEVLVNTAVELAYADLCTVHGVPHLGTGEQAQMSVCALGKCGGRELGFASDIELMFLYSGNGRTSGPKEITTGEFFEKLVENFMNIIRAKREGIFHVDLQLRPYGKAGTLSVSLESFRRYFIPAGPAWPYERQALIRLRPIAGDFLLGEQISALRDRYVYTAEPFDVVAMRGMRERQIRHLVKAGTFNPKYSPGALVDVEYLVQGLQMTHGFNNASLRGSNTRLAMAALSEAGILPLEDYTHLRKAHTFLRWLIDSLRVVAGNAKDLVIPPPASEEYAFLARRLQYNDLDSLTADLKTHTAYIQEVNRRLLGG